MRRMISGGENPSFTVALSFFAAFRSIFFCSIFFSSFHIYAQELPPQIVSVVEQIASEGGDAEELVNHFERLAARRLSINALDRRELESSLLFSSFQIESLLAYRQEYGDVLSVSELSLIDGFGLERAQMCTAFFTFESNQGKSSSGVSGPGAGHTSTVKVSKKYRDDGISLTGKYLYESGRHLSTSLTVDMDAGERFADFISASCIFSGDGIVKRVVAGDYSARFGQGLVLWKSFSMNIISEPSSVAKRGSGIRQYTSAGESDYLRGGALTMGGKKWELSVLGSYTPVDARVVGDSAYTSIVTDGYHRSDAERAKRHAMHETLFGANFSFILASCKLSLTAAAYSYDKINARRVLEYNRYQMYDGVWGNIGADVYGSVRHLRYFAEAALDRGGSFAFTGGILWSPSYSFEGAFSLRHYPRSYIATHAGAFSSLSTCSNQEGCLLSLRWMPSSSWTFRLGADAAYHPWSRYRIDGASWLVKSKLSLTYSFAGGSNVEALIGCNGSGRCLSSDYDSVMLRARLRSDVVLPGGWDTEFSIEGNAGGIAGYLGGGYTTRHGRFKVSVRVELHCISDWNHRIYIYESGIPQSFGLKALYGKGWGGYVAVKYSPVKWLELRAGCSLDQFAFLTRIFLPA